MSAGSRPVILGRIREALGDRRHLPSVHAHEPLPGIADNRQHTTDLAPQPTDLVARFTTELEKLGGQFISLPVEEAEEWLVAWLRERGASDVLSWEQGHLPAPGLLDGLRQANIAVETRELPRAEPERSAALARWEGVKVGLTGADAVLADTATLALRAGPGRPRLASLSVEAHVALVTEAQWFSNWEAWLRAAGPEAGDWAAEASNLTLISGPSRTADIEMTLTVGVHGPRDLIVVLVTGYNAGQ